MGSPITAAPTQDSSEFRGSGGTVLACCGAGRGELGQLGGGRCTATAPGKGKKRVGRVSVPGKGATAWFEALSARLSIYLRRTDNRVSTVSEASSKNGHLDLS